MASDASSGAAAQDGAAWYDVSDDHAPYVPLKQRRLQKQQQASQRGTPTPVAPVAPSGRPSLLEETRRHAADARAKTEAEREQEEEARILEAHSSRRRLVSAAERAADPAAQVPVRRSWRPPRRELAKTDADYARRRRRYHVTVEGDDVPPFLTTFEVRQED